MMFKLIGLGAIGYAGYRVATRKQRNSNAAFSAEQPDAKHATVRDAGAGSMRDGSPDTWTQTDEELDQSFPASDPPANY